MTKGAATLSSATATTNGFGLATIDASITNQSSDVQVSACVAPGNTPCQTFTLFSTPPSMWTLETVSGSAQVVTTGQTFQPLVMRVTDGTLAADPVLGVTVTFVTTLARINPGHGGWPPGGGSADHGAADQGAARAQNEKSVSGQSVLLGSSQTQVVTTQDGLALIMPSAGNVGPCDVFSP